MGEVVVTVGTQLPASVDVPYVSTYHLIDR
jgi:hypothetical protein